MMSSEEKTSLVLGQTAEVIRAVVEKHRLHYPITGLLVDGPALIAELVTLVEERRVEKVALVARVAFLEDELLRLIRDNGELVAREAVSYTPEAKRMWDYEIKRLIKARDRALAEVALLKESAG